VKRFIGKIEERSILLKEINANLVNKRMYIKKMIAVIKPDMDFEEQDK